MKQKDDPEHDARLRSRLREWEVESNWSPRSHAVVWDRIAAVQMSRPLAGFEWLLRLNDWLLRPQGAVAALVVFALVGSGLGWVSGQDRLDRHSQTMTTQYVRSVDPYQMNPALFQ